MLNKMKKIILNPWLIAIGSMVIGTQIIAVSNSINFIEAITVIYNVIISALNYKIPIKVILLSLVISFIIFKIYKYSGIKKELRPPFLDYTKDKYKEWIFKWEYLPDFGETYSVSNIRPICNCGCRLILKQQQHKSFLNGGILVCPNCDNTYKPVDHEIINEVNALIYHNIEKKNYGNDISV